MIAELLRRYQAFDPDTGEFTSARSQHEFADLLGVPQSTLSGICRGARANPREDILQDLIRAFPAHRDQIARDYGRLVLPDSPN